MTTQTTQPPIYDPVAVQPMRDELTAVGFEESRTPADLDDLLKNNEKDETVLVVVNSVCGCAAGCARPGISLALQNKVIPDRITTIFAGMDRDALDHLRNGYLSDVTPSSPCIALFKNGSPELILHRHNIEGRTAEEIAGALKQAFEELCNNEGPSVSPEHFAQVQQAKACGSKIPKYEG